jgi:hypothetical protein
MTEQLKISGTLHKVLVMETGTSSNGYWQRQQFIVKTKGSYPKTVCVTAWKDNCDLIPNTVGKDITVTVNPSSKEVNGKWYTELTLFKVEY